MKKILFAALTVLLMGTGVCADDKINRPISSLSTEELLARKQQLLKEKEKSEMINRWKRYRDQVDNLRKKYMEINLREIEIKKEKIEIKAEIDKLDLETEGEAHRAEISNRN